MNNQPEQSSGIPPHPTSIPKMSNLEVEQKIWKDIHASIPKVIFFLGYDMNHFYDLGAHFMFTPITLNKMKMVSQKFNLHPLEYLLYATYAIITSPHQFIQFIFNYVASLGLLQQWIDYVHHRHFPKIYFSIIEEHVPNQ